MTEHINTAALREVTRRLGTAHPADVSKVLDALDEALDELPAAQREVFIAHEFKGQSFKEISAETGISVNTLLSRKRYAVLHLRSTLQSIYDTIAKS